MALMDFAARPEMARDLQLCSEHLRVIETPTARLHYPKVTLLNSSEQDTSILATYLF
jgi:hypothetical protein